MNCEMALLLIVRSLEGDLNSFEEALLEDHLASCPNCMEQAQEIIQDQEDIQTYFRDLQPLSPDFTEKVMSQVKKQPKTLFWNSPLLKVASVEVLLVGISFFAYAFSHNGGPEIIAKKPDSQLAKLADEKETTPVENKTKEIPITDTVKKSRTQQPAPTKYPEPDSKADQPIKQEEPQEYAALRSQPEATSPPDQIRALGIAPEAKESVQDDQALSAPLVGYLPEGYHLAHQSEEKDPKGKVKSIYLYYLPQDEKFKPNNGLPWNKYLAVTLEEGSVAGEKENSVFNSPQGEKEVQRSLGDGGKKLKVVIKSKGIREWELIKILDSIELQNQE